MRFERCVGPWASSSISLEQDVFGHPEAGHPGAEFVTYALDSVVGTVQMQMIAV